MKKKLFFTFYFLIFNFVLFAANNDALMQEANNSYSKQDYNKAIELYKKVTNEGYESFKLYYNLGNSYFKLNQIPSALLYYEKAKKLNPSDEDLSFNLKVANSRIVDKIDVIPELFIKTWGDNIVNLFNTDEWAKLTIISFCLCIALLLLYLLSTKLAIRKIGFWLAILMFIFSLMSYIFAREQYSDVHKIKEAIVFTPTVNIKSSPDQSSTDIFVIHEGLKVKVIDQVSDWYEIRIANGSKGWIKTSDIEII